MHPRNSSCRSQRAACLFRGELQVELGLAGLLIVVDDGGALPACVEVSAFVQG
jgi:hypothetical protein